MALYNVYISSNVSFDTEIEAESEEEAKMLAMEEWENCDVSEMEFWNTHIADVWMNE